MYANEREAKATAAHRMADGKTAPAQLRTQLLSYIHGRMQMLQLNGSPSTANEN